MGGWGLVITVRLHQVRCLGIRWNIVSGCGPDVDHLLFCVVEHVTEGDPTCRETVQSGAKVTGGGQAVQDPSEVCLSMLSE